MNIDEKFSGFKSAERPSVGLALVFDISGFTKFFNKPDIHFYMTGYINQVIDCVETIIWGGDQFWLGEDDPARKNTSGLPIKPIMRKFLGDGMLYVWEDDETRMISDPEIINSELVPFKVSLINRLWNLQMRFASVNRVLNDYIPIGDLPTSIKIGIAQGSIFKLTENDGSVDCIGPCINLASRLVKYCPELNFIASARLNMGKPQLEKYRYMKVIATELRSFENEIVIVDQNDYEALNEVDQERLFKYLSI